MKQKILLSFLVGAISATCFAQKKQTAFAITGPQKGHSGWTEVRLVDVATGEEVQSIYKSAQQIDLLNARTGKPVIKKDKELTAANERRVYVVSTASPATTDKDGKVALERKVRTIYTNSSTLYDKPFSTNSAACAYDKKHDRLYYTPMGINELRYIDLKSKTPRIYYFENEAFGALKGPRDVPNQITRMVIAADGNGYALTNNANHLIRFTTNKKSVITDLGVINDDPSNTYSIRNQSCYGGDMVAHSNGDLYLVTANRKVFQINVENKTAKFLGEIKGLPRGFTTNGAMVDEGMKVIVCSSNSTLGYFRFDVKELQAEKVSSSGSVYNASDLANANLLTEKKKRKKERLQQQVIDPEETKPENIVDSRKKPTLDQMVAKNSIAVYPNPVTNGFVKLVFRDQPEGKYKVQLLDISGKLVSQQEVTVNNKLHVQEIKLPGLITAGNYMMQVVDNNNKIVSTEKLVVQQ